MNRGNICRVLPAAKTNWGGDPLFINYLIYCTEGGGAALPRIHWGGFRQDVERFGIVYLFLKKQGREGNVF